MLDVTKEKSLCSNKDPAEPEINIFLGDFPLKSHCNVKSFLLMFSGPLTACDRTDVNTVDFTIFLYLYTSELCLRIPKSK